MQRKEEELFLALCQFNKEQMDDALLEYASPCVLGHLFFNRMQGVAYGVLQKKGMLGSVSREFRNSIREAYERNVEKNGSFLLCIEYLKERLRKFDGKYALLKGAYLCHFYPEGYRTSNDIDILVMPETVTEIGLILLDAGFKQGNIRNGVFVPASRKEIIESKMMRGETVPYIKEINLPGMRYLEVDINFSLDYKNSGGQLVNSFLERNKLRNNKSIEIQTLEESDFFIHLCCHLHKETTTLPWVEMKRDMTMYKYGDIYLLLEEMSNQKINDVFERASGLGLDKICAFSIIQTAELFDVNNVYAIELANSKLNFDHEFLHQVIEPKEKKIFTYYEKDIRKRFFADNRKELLKEVEKI